MSQQKTILAIDNGTQSIRAILFDLQGNIIAKSQVPLLNAYFSEQPDWCEQHPTFFWDSLCRACNELWKKPEVVKDSIQAVAITTMRNTAVNLNKQGNPLRPAIIWTDKRKTKSIESIKGFWKYAFKFAGVEDTIKNFQQSCQAAWIAENQPEIWDSTDKFLLLSGYLNYKLTGEYKDSLASQVGYIPFDYKRHQWAKNNDWKWQVAPLKKTMLTELVKPGDKIGTVNQEASLLTGIPEGVSVIAAGADKSSEVLGSGCIENNQACISYGTTATINVTSEKYLEPIAFVPPYPSNVADAFTIEYQIYRGYWMVSWFTEQFGKVERDLSSELGISAEQLLDKSITDIAPGSDGLMLQPYWSPGVKIPGPEARGAIIGFSDVHTRAHVYRAILEGIAYGLREGKEAIERKTKKPMEKLIVSGGGSQSDVAMQITADIFNMPAIRPHTYETSALGAAINAAIGIGAYADYQEAVTAMCRQGEEFTPIAENVKIYEQLYQSGYKKLYQQLKPIYQKFHELFN